jgi:hypothetical protein
MDLIGTSERRCGQWLLNGITVSLHEVDLLAATGERFTRQ